MGKLALKSDKVRLWAGLGLLVIVLCGLLGQGKALAEDRKTRVATFLSSGTYTPATAYSTGFEVSAYSEAQILVDVVSGVTSTLDITVQVSDDNTTYYTHTAMTQITTAGQYRQAVTNFGKYVRLKYVLGGTSFVFKAVGVFKN